MEIFFILEFFFFFALCFFGSEDARPHSVMSVMHSFFLLQEAVSLSFEHTHAEPQASPEIKVMLSP